MSPEAGIDREWCLKNRLILQLAGPVLDEDYRQTKAKKIGTA
jgi:hypothetical protein